MAFAPAVDQQSSLGPRQNDSPSRSSPERPVRYAFTFNPKHSPHEMWANAPVLAPVKTMQLPTDAPEQDRGEALSQITVAAIAAAAKRGEEVQRVISDTDHRVRGSLAVIGALARHLGQAPRPT